MFIIISKGDLQGEHMKKVERGRKEEREGERYLLLIYFSRGLKVQGWAVPRGAWNSL